MMKIVFTIQMKNRFQTLHNAEADSNDIDIIHWKIVSAYTKSCETFLDPKVKNKAKEWIKPDRWKAVKRNKTS